MNDKYCFGRAVRPGTDITTVLCPVCEKQDAECSQDFRKQPDHELANDRGWVKYALPCDDCMIWCSQLRAEENKRRNAEQRAKSMPNVLVKYGCPAEQKEAELGDFAENIQLAVSGEGGFFIHGPAGSGKTRLATALMREDLMRREEAEMVDLADLLMRIRNSFRDDAVESELDIVAKYSTIKNLYIDDFGADKITDFVISTLRLIINKRLGNRLKTTITTNLTPEDIPDVYGERITSRIFGMCDVIYLQGKDKRSKI